jgi:hypothetical protein
MYAIILFTIEVQFLKEIVKLKNELQTAVKLHLKSLLWHETNTILQ